MLFHVLLQFRGNVALHSTLRRNVSNAGTFKRKYHRQNFSEKIKQRLCHSAKQRSVERFLSAVGVESFLMR